MQIDIRRSYLYSGTANSDGILLWLITMSHSKMKQPVQIHNF
ncbi:MAG: hypothetical protein ACI9UT_001130, partial [Flavobacteriales bacterium]|jgi:hypothetical protein